MGMYDDGILIIAAAGNGGASASVSYPAGYPHVMSVAAVDSNGQRASFSQNDDQVEIAAPGKGVKSTITDSNGESFSYASWSGTSMACPHVAGVAALVWSHFPNCTNNQIRNVLIKSAQDKGAAGCDEDYGHGIVKAQAAYDLLNSMGCSAGGESPVPLSDGGVGGCTQDPDYVPPTTAAPTPFECDDKVFQLDLTTDDYGSETHWDIQDSNNGVVTVGEGYASKETFVEKRCLEDGVYTFTIYDTYGDGMCCSYGTGSYKVTYDGAVLGEGGEFQQSESVELRSSTSSSTSTPSTTAAPTTTTTTTTTTPPTTPEPEPSCPALEALEAQIEDCVQQGNVFECQHCASADVGNRCCSCQGSSTSTATLPRTVTETTTTSPALGQCKAWCASNGKSWEKKCTWTLCAGCPSCNTRRLRASNRFLV